MAISKLLEWFSIKIASLFIPIGMLFVIVLWSIFYGNSKESYWLNQQEIFISINSCLNIVPGVIWANLTLVGNAAVVFPLTSIALLYKPQAWAALWSTALIAGPISSLSKDLFAMPRPGKVIDIESFIVIGKMIKGYSALPSGHTITIFGTLFAFLYTLVIRPEAPKFLYTLLLCTLFGTVLGFSRVAIGAHWPLDIGVGAAIGWLCGFVGAEIANRNQLWWQYMLKGAKVYVLCAVLLIWSFFIVAKALNENNILGLPMHIVAAIIGCVSAIELSRRHWIKTRFSNKVPVNIKFVSSTSEIQ